MVFWQIIYISRHIAAGISWIVSSIDLSEYLTID